MAGSRMGGCLAPRWKADNHSCVVLQRKALGHTVSGLVKTPIRSCVVLQRKALGHPVSGPVKTPIRSCVVLQRKALGHPVSELRGAATQGSGSPCVRSGEGTNQELRGAATQGSGSPCVRAGEDTNQELRGAAAQGSGSPCVRAGEDTNQELRGAAAQGSGSPCVRSSEETNQELSKAIFCVALHHSASDLRYLQLSGEDYTLTLAKFLYFCICESLFHYIFGPVFQASPQECASLQKQHKMLFLFCQSEGGI
ncbi:hypothetical protein NDU88_000547 [Pleurodeles waltl]|uniref:Uncharacterized protein n=1 Tax=Pleurodeles waltl TaxID=8319 RepID=A0AAV7SX03_PLEWA|nr:hypothetical protein NDU88_000547 [Pleurodeles waltl]